MFKDVDVQEIEKKKKDQEMESSRRPTNMKVILIFDPLKERFGLSNLDLLEEEFKSKTVGLVTREEFKRKRENIDNLIEQDQLKRKQVEGEKRIKEKLQRKIQYHKKTTLLSFDPCEDEEEEKKQKELLMVKDETPQSVVEPQQTQIAISQEDSERLEKKPLSGYGKDKTVNTAFLPDLGRDNFIKDLKRQFTDDFLKEQENVKNQLIDIKFQYWDGSYIIKSLTVKKNTTVLKFLEEARKEIIKDFAFIKEYSPEDLIIVMKDMILPHKLTFYDMIAHKVKNKSGNQLFLFDKMKVQGGGLEYEVEVEKSGTAKIIEKFKYDKINHIYPCSIWEVVDINKFK